MGAIAVALFHGPFPSLYFKISYSETHLLAGLSLEQKMHLFLLKLQFMSFLSGFMKIVPMGPMQLQNLAKPGYFLIGFDSLLFVQLIMTTFLRIIKK